MSSAERALQEDSEKQTDGDVMRGKDASLPKEKGRKGERKFMTELEKYLKRKQKRHCNLLFPYHISGYDIGIVAVQGKTKAAAAIIINRLADDRWAFLTDDLEGKNEEEMISCFLQNTDITKLEFGHIMEICEGLYEKEVPSNENALDFMLQRWHSLHPESDSGEAALYVITSSLMDGGVTEETSKVLIEFNGIVITVEETAEGSFWTVYDGDEKTEGVQHGTAPVITAIDLFMEYFTSVPDCDEVLVFGDGDGSLIPEKSERYS